MIELKGEAFRKCLVFHLEDVRTIEHERDTIMLVLKDSQHIIKYEDNEKAFSEYVDLKIKLGVKSCG